MAPKVEPGTKWVLTKGQHAGSIIEVAGQTAAGSVKHRTIKGGANVGSSPEDDEGRVHTTPLSEFLTLHEPKEKHGSGKIQPAFRQNNALRKAMQMAVKPQDQPATQVAPAHGVPNGSYVHPGKTAGLGVGVEMITPAMAQSWLDRGGPNRTMNERNIERLQRAIMSGEWGLTGDTIKLDTNGRVRDGQHRLTAIVRAGVGVPCLVVRGIGEKEFDKIDTGKRRDMADVLSIHGHANRIALASTVRGLLLIESYGRFYAGTARTGGTQPSNAQGVEYIDAHPEVKEALKEADRLRVSGGFIGGLGLWGIALTMFWRIDPEQTRVFVDSLIEGANLELGSPILKIRNMYRGRTREWHATAENRERLLAIVIKGWNAWRRDELVSSLSWHSTGRSAEKFPVAE